MLVPRPVRLGRSLTDAAPRPSITATATCLIRATEQHRQANARLVDDPYARLFLPEPLRTLAGSRYRPLRSMTLADPLTPVRRPSSCCAIASSTICSARRSQVQHSR